MTFSGQNKTGIVLGRFQPMHPGHIYLVEKAFEENDFVVVCIGSAQIQIPLTLEERHKRWELQMKNLRKSNYKIIDLIDPEPISIWPHYMLEKCSLLQVKDKTLYRSDNDIPTEQLKELKELGVKLKICERISFQYRAPNGIYYKANSASDIRAIHKNLNLENLL